jgi:hypothetical protein
LGYKPQVGANVVRLVRADHRRIAGLVERLGRPHRAGDSLRLRLAAEIAGHAHASTRALLPFAKSRVSDLGDTRRSLEELTDLARRLDECVEPVPADLLDRARSIMYRHVEVEEDATLRPLDDVVAVSRLREVGEAFRRHSAAVVAARRPASPQATDVRAELYERARRSGIAGRSSMSRDELHAALRDGTG